MTILRASLLVTVAGAVGLCLLESRVNAYESPAGQRLASVAEKVAEVDAVRRGGPEAFRMMLDQRKSGINAAKARAVNGNPDPDDRAFFDLIDAAAEQRDAAWSGLFWYTSLDRAKAAAESEG